MTETIEKTLPELCEELGLKLQLKKAKAPHNASEWQKKSTAWLAVVSYNGYSTAFPYFTGSAIKRTTVSDVVYSLCSDWNTWKQCENVDDFAGLFGWDKDTLSVWQQLEKGAKEWEHFIGDTATLEMLAGVEY